MPTTPVDSAWLGTSRHLALPSVEGGYSFPLLTLGHAEVIKGAAELRRDLVEHFGRNLQVEVGVAKLSGYVLKWSAGYGGDPQCPQELEARQTSWVFHRVPFVQLGVCLDHLRVLQQLVAEVIHHSGDGEDATEAFIQGRLRHDSSSRRSPCCPTAASGPQPLGSKAFDQARSPPVATLP